MEAEAQEYYSVRSSNHVNALFLQGMSQQYIAPFHNADSLRSFKEASFHQKSAVFWLTGLSGSGKSTLAYLVDQMLTNEGKYSIVLDGDDLRSGVNADLGLS